MLDQPKETVESGMIHVNVTDARGHKPFNADKILIDGGSNEVFRPNNPYVLEGYNGW